MVRDEGDARADAVRTPRVALYSHDAMGMGHLRRNILIAQTLAAVPPGAGTLCVTGARGAAAASFPAGVDCVTLPALRKEARGRRYEARSLPLAAGELVALRSKTLVAVLTAFDPDVLIVDKLPRGLLGELDAALRSLRALGRTRCVLGLRDVLDDPPSVCREWRDQGNEAAIRRYYDAVWVYGDPAVYDPVREYGLSRQVAAKVRYTGYLDQRARLAAGGADAADPLRDLALPPGRLAVCVVGGGEDGAELAEAFAGARLPPHLSGVVVAGPMMPGAARERLHRRAAAHPRMRVLDSLAEPGALIARADCVVAMGGYNTTCEVLSHGKRALIVPRVHPRREQLIRAERLRELGAVDVLHPDGLSAAALTAWLACADRPAPDVRGRIDLGGLDRIPQLMAELLAAPWAEQPAAAARSGGRTSAASHTGGEVAWRTPNRRASDMS